MCHTRTSMSLTAFFKKAIQIQSPRIQCCLCAFSVFSALFGMFMMSAGICLVLNYNFMEVDTSGLPSHLHNEEGKKVVGIILLCVGLGSLGLSALVSALYFTACLERGSSQTSVGPEGGVTSGGQSDRSLQNGGHSARPSRSLEGHDGHHHGHHHHGNGGTPGRSSPAFNGAHPSSRRSSSSSSLRFQAMVSGQKRAGSLPALGKDGPSYSQRMHAARTNISTPPSVRSQQKSRKKAMRHGHHGKFQNPLTSHPEEEEQSLNESRSRSMSGKRRSTSRSPERQRGGHVNYGADLNDDSVLTREPSGSSESSTATPPIKVDSSHLRNETYTNDAQYSEIDETGSSGETTQLSDQADEVDSTVFRVNPRVDKTRDFDEGDQDSGVKVEEEESGRWSRSTDSLGESETGAESFEEAKKRLDDRMQQVIE